MKTLEVNITEEDIQKGEKHNCFWCPIALSIRRVLKSENIPFSTIVVGGEQINIININKGMNVPLPDNARDFIYKYDNDQGAIPFNFRIEL